MNSGAVEADAVEHLGLGVADDDAPGLAGARERPIRVPPYGDRAARIGMAWIVCARDLLDPGVRHAPALEERRDLARPSYDA